MPKPEKRRAQSAAIALTASLLLAGCQSPPFSQVPGLFSRPEAVAAAAPRPAARPRIANLATVAPTDPVSADLTALYGRIEAQRRSQGLLRLDDGSRDGTLSPGRLTQIWTEVALRDEHLASDLSRPGGPALLRRWEVPVVYRLEFGNSVPAAVQSADRVQVSRLVARMASATGHPMQLAPAGSGSGNFHVLILSEAERQAIGPRLRRLVPGIDEGTLRLVTELPTEVFCLAIAFARGGGAVYTDAVAIIRAEHPDLTRIACYHEEMAQGLGLAADSPRARPSLFNDAKEFARLTRLDLLMLRLHYDPRLRPGWGEREARPVAFTIATELAAGET